MATTLDVWDKEVGATLYRVAKQRKVSDKILLALFEAAIVESHVRNCKYPQFVNYGHADSLGVLQQRPSCGWTNVMDVEHATNAFIDHALRKDKPDMTAGALAQKVQISAYPDRYPAAESMARTIIEILGGF